MKRGRVRVESVAAALCTILATIKACNGMQQSLEILPGQKDQRFVVHGPIVFTCTPKVDHMNMVTHLQWKDPRGYVINSSYIGPNPDIFTVPDKQALLLHINGITSTMVGNYTCVATYAASEHLSASVWLDKFEDDVEVIRWLNAPKNQYAVKGKDFQLMCQVTAEPEPSFVWFKDGRLLSNSGRYVILRNGLQIKDVVESDEGHYTCRTSVIGPKSRYVAERNIKLDVLLEPDVLQPIEKTIKVKEGESAYIACKATGKPQPTFKWIKDSTKQNLSLLGSKFSVSELYGTIRIDSVEASDSGEYSCHASNLAGQAVVKFVIDVVF